MRGLIQIACCEAHREAAALSMLLLLHGQAVTRSRCMHMVAQAANPGHSCFNHAPTHTCCSFQSHLLSIPRVPSSACFRYRHCMALDPHMEINSHTLHLSADLLPHGLRICMNDCKTMSIVGACPFHACLEGLLTCWHVLPVQSSKQHSHSLG